MTLQATIKATYRLILSERGESVVFVDPRGEVEKRTIVVSITANKRDNTDQRTHDNLERIEVFCLRDEADPDYGGVQELYAGARIYRDGDEDQNNDRGFGFSGEIMEQGPSYYRAVFHRQIRIAHGRGRGSM